MEGYCKRYDRMKGKGSTVVRAYIEEEEEEVGGLGGSCEAEEDEEEVLKTLQHNTS